MKDAIAYMAWERVVPWKILSIMAHPDDPMMAIGITDHKWTLKELLNFRVPPQTDSIVKRH